jgi:hypothetical protein
MREVRDAISQILDSTTLATVCGKVDAARQKRQEIEAFTYEI